MSIKYSFHYLEFGIAQPSSSDGHLHTESVGNEKFCFPFSRKSFRPSLTVSCTCSTSVSQNSGSLDNCSYRCMAAFSRNLCCSAHQQLGCEKNYLCPMSEIRPSIVSCSLPQQRLGTPEVIGVDRWEWGRLATYMLTIASSWQGHRSTKSIKAGLSKPYNSSQRAE